MIYDWDVPSQEEGVVKGWMAEWQLPVEKSETVAMPMERPRWWKAGVMGCSEDEKKVVPALEDGTNRLHLALTKFGKSSRQDGD